MYHTPTHTHAGLALVTWPYWVSVNRVVFDSIIYILFYSPPSTKKAPHQTAGAPILGQNTLALATTEPGKLFLVHGDLNAHSPLWDEHQPADQRGELVDDWFLSQKASILNDCTATCVNRGTGGLSKPDITTVSNAWSTGTEWTVGEDLGSDRLPITTTIRCEVPAASASQRRTRWNTRNVYWNSFSAAVEEAIELFSTAPLSLGDRVHRFNSVLLAAAKLHVGKSKAG